MKTAPCVLSGHWRLPGSARIVLATNRRMPNLANGSWPRRGQGGSITNVSSCHRRHFPGPEVKEGLFRSTEALRLQIQERYHDRLSGDACLGPALIGALLFALSAPMTLTMREHLGPLLRFSFTWRCLCAWLALPLSSNKHFGSRWSPLVRDIKAS